MQRTTIEQMQPAPAHTAPKVLAFPHACAACGAPLGAAYWVTDYPRAAHTECIDWQARPFPFSWALPVLRTLYRQAQPGERPAVVRIGTALRTLQDQWPRHGAHVVVLASHLVHSARTLPVYRRGRPRL